ncbi:hypothetical protein [Sulfuriflexus sp.]|uniref:hypothetical protein n=1 Tax=Sulfuriflexus sp. TaxID=2015443 RepID=UPI0028CD8806|nr:hypothetical protein [Sulfuriflexus sp.]MDT8404348.1 hypothetical protein [Sulfuriflexus sp.]
MNFYIKERPDNTVLLLSDIGQTIATFNSLEDAVDSCSDWLEHESQYGDYSECFVLD